MIIRFGLKFELTKEKIKNVYIIISNPRSKYVSGMAI